MGKGYVTSLKLTQKGQYDLRNRPLMKRLSTQSPTGGHVLWFSIAPLLLVCANAWRAKTANYPLSSLIQRTP